MPYFWLFQYTYFPKFIIGLEVGSATYHLILFLMSLPRIAVPLFFMISGALLLNQNKNFNIKKFYTKSMLKLITSFFFWTIFYAIFIYFIENFNSITLLGFLENLISKIFSFRYHLWYLVDLIIIYAFVPVLRLFVKTENMKYFDYLTIFFLALSVIKSIFSIFNISAPGDNLTNFFPFEFLNNFGFFILGWYLHNKNFSNKILNLIKIFGIISIIALPLITVGYSLFFTERAFFFDKFVIFNILHAIFVFCSFKNKKENSETFNNKIDKLSKHVFGIYLVHDIFMRVQDLFLPFDFIINNHLILPYYLITLPVVFFLSLLLTIIIKKCFKKLSKWII